MSTLADLLFTMGTNNAGDFEEYDVLEEYLKEHANVIEARTIGRYVDQEYLTVRAVLLFNGKDSSDLDEHLEDALASRGDVVCYDMIGDYLDDVSADAFEQYVDETSIDDLPPALREAVIEPEEEAL